MPRYPELETLPPECLVPLDQQPEYLPLDGLVVPDEVNLCEEMVDAHVRAGLGERPAIIFADEHRALTFDELLAEVERTAGALVGEGLRPGERVAVRSGNRPETTVAVLAVWRAGGIVVPTPPQARAGEIPFYLNDTRARFLLVGNGEPLAEVVAAAGGPDEAQRLGVERIFVLGRGSGTPFAGTDELAAGAGPLRRPVRLSGDMPAVIWHTAGTTGTPKACYHTAGQFMAGGHAAARAFGFGPDDVQLAFPGPAGHAGGFVGRTNLSLLHGVPFVEVERFSDPDAVLAAMVTYQVTWASVMAATWSRMLPLYLADPAGRSLSRLQSAYAPQLSVVSSDVPRRWAEAGIDLRDHMGSTQFGTWFVTPARNDRAPQGCVGPPAPGYVARILELSDAGDRETEPGEPGVLGLRGPTGLTYWDRPELQKRDVRGGWTILDDVCRADTAGRLWYLGRSDFMINASGFKVSPIEVEDVLGRHAAVAEVAVVASPDPERGEVVTAWIVPSAEAVVSEALAVDIQQFAKQTAAPYKYPRRIVFTDALPRDPIGKVQVRRLRDESAGLDFNGGRHAVVKVAREEAP